MDFQPFNCDKVSADLQGALDFAIRAVAKKRPRNPLQYVAKKLQEYNKENKERRRAEIDEVAAVDEGGDDDILGDLSLSTGGNAGPRRLTLSSAQLRAMDTGVDAEVRQIMTEAVHSENPITVVLDILQVFSSSSTHIQYCCDALAELASANPGNQHLITEGGGVEMTIAAMDKFAMDPVVMLKGTALLTNLSGSSRRRIVQAGAFGVLVNGLRMHCDEQLLLLQICRAFSVLIVEDDAGPANGPSASNHRGLAVAAGAEDALKMAVQKAPGNQTLAWRADEVLERLQSPVNPT